MVTMAKLHQRNAGAAGGKAVADLWVEGFGNITGATKRKERRDKRRDKRAEFVLAGLVVWAAGRVAFEL